MQLKNHLNAADAHVVLLAMLPAEPKEVYTEQTSGNWGTFKTNANLESTNPLCCLISLMQPAETFNAHIFLIMQQYQSKFNLKFY